MPLSIRPVLGLCLLALTPAVAGAAPALSRAEQQVLDLDASWAQAEMTGDRAALDRLLGDQFLATFGTSAPMDKDQFLKFVFDDPKAPKQQALSNRMVRITGYTAVVVETDTLSEVRNGKTIKSQARLTAVYVQQDGVWKAVALHMASQPTKP